MLIDTFDIKVCRENVLNLIDCFEDSPIYEEVISEYEEILEYASALLKPKAILEVAAATTILPIEIDSDVETVIYSVITVGREISTYASSLFSDGNYLAGMIVNAIADDMLFQMEHHISVEIQNICKKEGKGVRARVESPKDIPMEVQRIIVDATKSLEEIGVDATESYMLNPVKSTASVYLLDDNEERMNIEHDCSSCPNLECKMRTHKGMWLTVIEGGESKNYKVTSGTSLMEMLTDAGYFLPALCNGRGTCGKCRVKVLKGNIPCSREDEKVFTKEELNSGLRLACRAYPRFDCCVEMPSHREKDTVILAEGNIVDKEFEEYIQAGNLGGAAGEKGIIIDIGTTTIAMQLISLETGQVESTFTAINKQRAYGADVISRIEASVSGKKVALQESIRNDIWEGIQSLVPSDCEGVKSVIIGGNTTMIHLLMGYPCDTLGVSPFLPFNIETIHSTLKEVLGGDIFEAKVTILPGISTYVGGDIVSGLFALGFEKRDKVSVLIDLGTNGEMAIGNKDKLLVASTAAGPAFEGGNIICGVASVPGAICGVDLLEGEVQTRTIQDAKEIGICGTGVIEAIATLLANELLDETGLLEENNFEDGFLLAKDRAGKDISIYQKDIREIQLAKSAVRAGFETLLSKYGVAYEDIEHIYLAGGFGYKMNIQKAIEIGLLPKDLKERIVAVGNSCLYGAYKFLLTAGSEEVIQGIIDSAFEVQLSDDKEFSELYMEHMYFA